MVKSTFTQLASRTTLSLLKGEWGGGGGGEFVFEGVGQQDQAQQQAEGGTFEKKK